MTLEIPRPFVLREKFDADGNRTIGVISKCDLVPETSDIVKKIRMVRETDVKLNLGFIAVRNRGPGEEDMDIRTEEKRFFSTHKVLRVLLEHERGYATLSKKIVDLQCNHVENFIPKIQNVLQKRLSSYEKRLAELGAVPITSLDRRGFLMENIFSMTNSIGKYIQSEEESEDTNISSITYELSRHFADSVQEMVPDVFSTSTREKLLKAMRRKMGYTLPNFLSDTIFREYICNVFFNGTFHGYCEALLKEFKNLMDHVFEQLILKNHNLSRFPKLTQAILSEARKLLEKGHVKASVTIEVLLEAEKTQTFTLNSRYMSTINEARGVIQNSQKNLAASAQLDWLRKYHSVTQRSKDTPLQLAPDTKYLVHGNSNRNVLAIQVEALDSTDLMEQGVVDLQISIRIYTEILLDRLLDIIPILSKSLIVVKVHESLLVSLSKTFDDSRISMLFDEEVNIQRERLSIQTTLDLMKEAEKKLKEFPFV